MSHRPNHSQSLPPHIADFLPLHPNDFHILLSLTDEERYGYSIVKEIEEETGGLIQMEPGNLYRSMRRLLRDDLVAESDRKPKSGKEDERRRYYRLTPLGRQVVVAEAARLRATLAGARSRALLERP